MIRRALSTTATCLALAAFLAAPALAQKRAASPREQARTEAKERAALGPQLVAESRSKALCEAAPNRIFVTHFVGTECIAYYATPGQPTATAAVLYFNGDVPDEYLRKPETLVAYRNEFAANARIQGERAGVRVIFVARPGTFGSSGDHALRGERREMLIMNAAVDAIKARLGLTDLVLAGQSRGSQVAAVLMTMGRTDVRCAILGSGSLYTVENERQFQLRQGRRVSEESLAQTFYDPSRYLSEVPVDKSRRVFILGDKADTVTPFDQQMRFGERLQELGHHARILEIKAQGRDMHGATHLALPAAIMCARGASDDQIAWIVTPTGETPAKSPTGPAARSMSHALPRS